MNQQSDPRRKLFAGNAFDKLNFRRASKCGHPTPIFDPHSHCARCRVIFHKHGCFVPYKHIDKDDLVISCDECRGPLSGEERAFISRLEAIAIFEATGSNPLSPE